jgi:hypothetical protein
MAILAEDDANLKVAPAKWNDAENYMFQQNNVFFGGESTTSRNTLMYGCMHIL